MVLAKCSAPERGLHKLDNGEAEEDGGRVHEDEEQLQQALRSACGTM